MSQKNQTLSHEEIEALKNITKKLTSKESVEDKTRFVIESIHELLDPEQIAVAIEDEAGTLFLKTQRGLSETFARKFHKQIYLLDSSPWKDVKKGSPIVVCASDGNYVSMKLEKDFSCGVFVPIFFGKSVHGFLFIANEKGVDITGIKIELLEIFSNIIATAIELDRLNDLIKTLSVHDSETGLLNPNAFHIRLHEEIQSSDRYGIPFSILVLDMDMYRPYLETHGSKKAAKFLKDVADILNDACRRSDVVAKYGMDSFIILAPSSDTKDSKILAERIMVNITKFKFEESSPKATASIGVYERLPKRERDSIEIINRAKEALTESRRAGGNKVGYYKD